MKMKGRKKTYRHFIQVIMDTTCLTTVRQNYLLLKCLLASCILWTFMCQCMIPESVLEKQRDCAVGKPGVFGREPMLAHTTYEGIQHTADTEEKVDQ